MASHPFNGFGEISTGVRLAERLHEFYEASSVNAGDPPTYLLILPG